MRDNNGRFTPGNPGGPGRPNRKTERAYLERLTKKLTMSKWNQICDKAIAQAIEGDKYAREWIANYLIGKPAQILELQTSDTALLARLIDAVEEQGGSASDLFNAMLAELEVTNHDHE